MDQSQASSQETLERGAVPLVSTHFVREVVAAARRNDADWKALLGAAGISTTLDRPVHIEQFARLWKDVGRSIDDDFLNQGDRRLPCGGLDFLAQAVASSATFSEAMTRALGYLRILIDRPRARLDVAGGGAEIVFYDADTRRSPFAFHLVWIIVGGLAGWLVGRRVVPRLVDFSCPPPAPSIDYRDMVRAPVRFSQPTTRFVFDAEYLDLPVIRQRDSLDVFLTQLPGILLLRYWDARTLSSTVRRKLTLLAAADWPAFDRLAQEMAIPASTLRRRLRLEGHSYRAIKDDIRRARAVRALLHSALSVEQIAAELGFAEPSAFHRAFRKWVSRSPGAFRRDDLLAR